MLLVNHLVFSKDLKVKEVMSSQAFWSYFRSYCLSYASGSIIFAERVDVKIRVESDSSLDKSASRNPSLLGSISLLPIMNRAVSIDTFMRSSAMMPKCPIWLKSEMSLLDKQGDICMHCLSEFSGLIEVLLRDTHAREALLRWIEPKDFESLIAVLYADLSSFVTVSRLSEPSKSDAMITQWDKYLRVAGEYYLSNSEGREPFVSKMCDFDLSER